MKASQGVRTCVQWSCNTTSLHSRSQWVHTFGLEADFRVRDLEMTELTLYKDFIFHVPQPTKLFFQLVTLIVDERESRYPIVSQSIEYGLVSQSCVRMTVGL